MYNPNPYYGMDQQQSYYGMDPSQQYYGMSENHTYFGSDQQHHGIDHNRILKVVQDCGNTCEHMINMLFSKSDLKKRTEQMIYLRDCADMCHFMAQCIARHSPFLTSVAQLCATICEVCGKECLKHKDFESQQCGEICLHCARECQALAMAK